MLPALVDCCPALPSEALTAMLTAPTIDLTPVPG
jgi:hypothetical protein